MKVVLWLSAVVAFAALTRAADPSAGWLSYAVFTAEPSDTITFMSSTMRVPDTPEESGGSPAFWFGVQTAKGDGALIQPIQSKWLGNSFYMFQEIFDWTDERDKQTSPIAVRAGDEIQASVTYVAASNMYLMNMTSKSTGRQSNFQYKLLPEQHATESVAYFVLEHQPRNCRELPPSGNVCWYDIHVEVNGKAVDKPLFVAKQEQPACGSQAIVDQAMGTVNITWTGV